jgi:hypothetical protein
MMPPFHGRVEKKQVEEAQLGESGRASGWWQRERSYALDESTNPRPESGAKSASKKRTRRSTKGVTIQTDSQQTSSHTTTEPEKASGLLAGRKGEASAARSRKQLGRRDVFEFGNISWLKICGICSTSPVSN